MKALRVQPTTALLFSLALAASAATRYVDVNSTNATPPYTNWATASTNIQIAVDAASASDEILVTNGVYAPVIVSTPLAVRSVYGPDFTVINGGGAARCLYLTNNAVMVGFTLTNGVAFNGGGAYCESTSAVLSNCVLSGNSASYGGGVYHGMLSNCVLTGNYAADEGGGARSSTLITCTLNSNRAGTYGISYGLTFGGGAHSSTLDNCTLSGNSANQGGGASYSALNRCVLSGNEAFPNRFGTEGGLGGGAYQCTLKNCILSGNFAHRQGGGEANCTLRNCTIIHNHAGSNGGDYQGGLYNCICYYNSPNNYSDSTMWYCCSLPTFGNYMGFPGNIGDEPRFVDYASGNLRLQTNSPCINAGRNADAPGLTDLDGVPRIVGGTVDIGAYEFQGAGSLISYAWLQQYGWPTDGSADFADPDGDGMNNWQEWRADTIPTNALSVLRIVTVTSGTPGLEVTWQSVTTRSYWLERATNLASLPSFSTVATNLVSAGDTRIYKDTTATNGGPFFYRVGVQP